MRIIKPSFEILEQGPGMSGVYDQIALCASTCYKSEPKTGDEAMAFVEKLGKNNHTAMLEFGTIYLNMPITTHYSADIGYYDNPYTIISQSNGFLFKDKFGDNVDCYCITTNLRAMIEHTPNVNIDLKELLVEPTDFHEKRICVKFITSIGVARELTRHRKFSFAQESTRYCNYSKEKFDNHLTIIKPYWLDDANPSTHRMFTNILYNTEIAYNHIVANGFQAQAAREVLPLCTKTEICMCGFVKDWEHFFELRALDKTGPAHPDMKAIAVPLYKEFVKRGYINELD